MRRSRKRWAIRNDNYIQIEILKIGCKNRIEDSYSNCKNQISFCVNLLHDTKAE